MAVLVKLLNGVAYASVKTKNGLAVADIKTINGIDVNSGGGFSPPDIAGLVLWLQGDNAPSGYIANWPDDSGNGNDAVESTDRPTKVSGVINGHDAVSFWANGNAGVNQRLVSPAALPADRSIFFVAKILSTPGVYGGIDTVLSGATDYTNGIVFLSNTFGSTTFPYYGGNGALYLDGVLAASPPDNWPTSSYAVGTAKGSALGSDSAIRLGQASGGIAAYASNVAIAEFIVYDSDLSTGDREMVEDYLGAKYAITITH